MPSPNRLTTTLLLTVFLVACGGGGVTDPGGNSTDPVPATVAVQQGDQQTAAPGTAVATAPSVVVRNAAGTPLPNIAVNFAVDSGGGTVAAASALTNSTGIASSGAWTLGATGPQVLGVTVGTLPKVKIRATLQTTTTTTITTQTIAPGGGTIAVALPGSSLDGTLLTFPAGALTSSTPITLGTASTAGYQLPSGTTANAAALTIASDGGKLPLSALLRLPLGSVDPARAVVLLRDHTTGQVQLLPRVSGDASSITVILPTLDLSPAPGSGGLLASLLSFFREDEPDLDVLLAALPPDALTRSYDSGFRPGTDDWDFPGMLIAPLSFLQPGIDGSVIPLEGMVATELWYYNNLRKGGAAKLSGSTQLQLGEPLSSRDGIRWSTYAHQDISAFYGIGTFVIRKITDVLTDDPVAFARQQFLAIRGQFFITSSRPVPILLTTSDPADDPALIGVAFRADGNVIDFAVPTLPGQVLHATLTDQGMTPMDLSLPNGSTVHVVNLVAMMYAALVTEEKVAAQYAQVTAHTIGKGQWPDSRLMSEGGELDTGKVFLDGELRHWWECPQCPEFGYHPSMVPASATHVLAAQDGVISNGAWSGLSQLFGSFNFSGQDVLANTATRSVGWAVYLPISASEGKAPAWLDWRTVTYRKLQLTPNPTSVALAGTQSVTFVVTPDVAPPAGTRYSWVLITSSARDSVETALPTFTRQIVSGTEGAMLVQAHEPVTRRIISHVSIPITPGAAPFWKLTSFADQDRLFSDDNDPGGTVATLLTQLLASPQRGLIAVTTVGNGTDFSLRVKGSGTWTATDCCPPTFAPGDGKITLGVLPAVSNTYGAFFSSWNSSSWSQSTTDLTTGTMSGQFPVGNIVYPVFQGGQQAGPEYGVRISATRNGNTLTGTITFTIFFVGDDDNMLHSEDVDDYRFPFTATLLKGVP